MPKCHRWERLYNHAVSQGNQLKALEFKEKLVECIVYSLWHLVREKELDQADELMKYGREVARKYSIPELEFHLNLIQDEINRIREIYKKIGRGEKV